MNNKVVPKLSSFKAFVLGNDLFASLLSTLSIYPELWGGLNLQLIIVAASAIAATILRDFPKVELLLPETAIAVASTVNLDVDASTSFLAEGIALGNKIVH